MDIFLKACTATAYWCVIYFTQRYHISLEALTIIVFLLGADIIIGITKSYILYWDKSDRWSWRKLVMWLLTKWAILAGFLCISIVLWFYWAEDAWEYFGDISTGIFLVATLSGITQNVLQIVKRKELEQWDAIAIVFDKIWAVLKAIVDNWVATKS